MGEIGAAPSAPNEQLGICNWAASRPSMLASSHADFAVNLASPVPSRIRPKGKTPPDGIGPAARIGISATRFLLPR